MGTLKTVIVVVGVGTVVAGALIGSYILMNRPKGPKPDALMGDNFFQIRREALALFPRGSRLNDTAEGLVAIGFRCQGVAHKMANVNAESLICDSHGRGYPSSPALNITVMARNGLVSDFEVWNMLQKADAETVEPPPAPVHENAGSAHGEGEGKEEAASAKEGAAPTKEAEASPHGKPAHAE